MPIRDSQAGISCPRGSIDSAKRIEHCYQRPPSDRLESYLYICSQKAADCSAVDSGLREETTETEGKQASWRVGCRGALGPQEYRRLRRFAVLIPLAGS